MRRIVLWAALCLCGFNVGTAAAQSGQPQRISDPAQFAHILITQRQFEQAENFIRDILSADNLSAQRREDLRYLLGLALSGQEKYPAAIAIFRDLLSRYPDDRQLRTVLGRTLFLNGDDSAAQRQFDLVLGGEQTNAALRRQALAHAAAIRQRNGWLFSSYFNVREDNNASKAPTGENRIVHIGGFPFEVNNRVKKVVAADFGFSGTHRHRIAGNLQWESGFSYGGGAQAGALDASTDVQISGGLRRLFADGSAGGAVFLSHRWARGQPVSDGRGVRLDVSKTVAEKWRLSSAAQILQSRSRTDSNNDSVLHYWQGRVDVGLSPVMTGNWQLTATDNNAVSPRNAYHSHGVSAGLRRDFSYGLTAGVSFSLSRTLYDGDFSALLPRRHQFIHKTARLSLLKRDLRFFTFSPEVSVVFNDRQSNIPFYSYDDRIFQIRMTKDF